MTASLPQNWENIYDFLTTNGYSSTAAEGILGNIEQESGGNPEAEGYGGGGLIGFTPVPSGYITGNTSADLQTQEQGILTYNNGIGASYIASLNAATSPESAATIYMNDFEKPGIPDASNRTAAAEAVANAVGSGGVSLDSATSGISSSGLWGLFTSQNGSSSLPGILERGGIIILGAILLIVGFWRLDSGKSKTPPPKEPEHES